MKKYIAVLLVVMVFSSGTVFALEELERTEPSAPEMVLDLIILRPAGIAATAAGAGIFIVALPFTLPTGSVGVSARKLVADPFAFTFMRPLGYDTANY